MQYVGRAIGSVASTWNSLNPATLSGAIDVIVIEQENGELACSPFHIRFGKFSLLRPSEKKVVFQVNGETMDFAIKVGDGGEAFFVFETEDDVPTEMQTSPVLSPVLSRQTSHSRSSSAGFQEPEFLDLSLPRSTGNAGIMRRARSQSDVDGDPAMINTKGWDMYSNFKYSTSAPDEASPLSRHQALLERSPSPNQDLTLEQANTLSRRFTSQDLPAKVTEKGDVFLDMTGYKAGKEELADAAKLAKQILAEELLNSDDIDNLIDADHEGNLWIYASGMNRDAAKQRLLPENDDNSIDLSLLAHHQRSDSRTYVKTLRLTSDQLKLLNLNLGANSMSFSVNEGRSTCTATMFYWKFDTPIIISDIDGTITKSDALGHVFTMLGRDWTHAGVAKLFSDIANNGYKMLYLTSRSVGQADATRAYLRGIDQSGARLPEGPVIMSPDRTMAALRREIYLRKPEVFKMACLRDIRHLFGEGRNPFYAGFGNRITDALSYRSVNIPSSRIFTINSYAEVRMELLELTGYKSSYFHIGDLVDHFFPPITLQVADESFTDFLFWREPIAPVSDSTSDIHTSDAERETNGGDDEDIVNEYGRDRISDNEFVHDHESHDSLDSDEAFA